MVSVVIPVYNSSKYLKDCIESLLQQTYAEAEFIFVDDGSTDASLEILEQYAAADRRIHVAGQAHRGVVEARKRGVESSRGEYISFVDSDDEVESSLLEHFVSRIGLADIATCGVKLERKNGSLEDLKDAFDEGFYDLDSEDHFLLENMIRYKGMDREGILQYAVGKLYKREILSRVMGELESRIHYAEDRELVYRYLMKAHSVEIAHAPLYVYRYHSDSALRTPNRNVLHDLNYLYQSLRGLFEQHPCADSLIGQLDQMIASRLYVATSLMGFRPENQTIRFLFPFFNLLDGKRLVLYGAGVVGCNYYRQTMEDDSVHWVLWVDKKGDGNRVKKISAITDTEYDYIVIAVRDKEVAEEIRRELKDLGVEPDRILWKRPIVLAE